MSASECTIIGFDSAWSGRQPGAICAVRYSESGSTFVPPRLVSFDQANDFIKLNMSKVTLIAIDQPTIVSNHCGMRPVERVAGSIVSALGGGVQPAYRNKREMFGNDAPIWKFINELNAELNPFLCIARDIRVKRGSYLIEVFPALSLPSLIPDISTRKRAAKYNPKNKLFLLSDWQLVCRGISEEANRLKLPDLATFAERMSLKAQPRKCDQDEIDSLICLLIAVRWYRDGTANNIVIGCASRGYMVAAANHDIRLALESAASIKQVPVDCPDAF